MLSLNHCMHIKSTCYEQIAVQMLTAPATARSTFSAPRTPCRRLEIQSAVVNTGIPLRLHKPITLQLALSLERKRALESLHLPHRSNLCCLHTPTAELGSDLLGIAFLAIA
jgi:hypothetical protein